MTTIIDSLVVTLGLDASGFKKGEKSTGDALENLKSKSGKTGKSVQSDASKSAQSFAKFRNEILAIATAFVSVGAVRSFTDRITTSDAAIGRMAKNIGMTTEDLTTWTMAADKAGGTADGMAGSIKGLVERVQQFALTGEGGESFKYFTGQGVQLVDQLTGKLRPMNDILLESADALGKMSPTQAQAWGKGMGFDEGTVNVLMQGRGAVEKLISSQRKLAVVNDKDAKQAAERQQAWAKVSNTLENAGRIIINDLQPTIQELASDFEAWIKKVDPKEVEHFFREIVDGGRSAVNVVGGLTNAIEGLFALWAGSKFLGMMGNIGKMGGLLSSLGLVGNIGKMGGLLSSLGLVGAAGAAGYAVGGEINAHLSDETKDAIGGTIAGMVERVQNLGNSAIGALISRGEGDYNSVNRGKAGGYKSGKENLEGMTVAEVMRGQKEQRFNAAGRYQIIGSTLADAVKALGLKGSEKFDKTTQDKIFSEYLLQNKRQAIGDYISGKSDDIDAALKAAAKEWASVADPDTGRSYYAGKGNNKASISSAELTQALNAERARVGGGGTSNHDVKVGQITINTQATDAKGIAKDVGTELEHYSFATQANSGIN